MKRFKGASATALALKILGWVVMVSGLIGGIFAAVYYSRDHWEGYTYYQGEPGTAVIIFFAILLCSIIYGAVLISLGYIVSLLRRIEGMTYLNRKGQQGVQSDEDWG